MENLKQIRLSKNLSIPDLVKLSGVPRRTLQDIEKRGDCKYSIACILADSLSVSLDDFRIKE